MNSQRRLCRSRLRAWSRWTVADGKCRSCTESQKAMLKGAGCLDKIGRTGCSGGVEKTKSRRRGLAMLGAPSSVRFKGGWIARTCRRASDSANQCDVVIHHIDLHIILC